MNRSAIVLAVLALVGTAFLPGVQAECTGGECFRFHHTGEKDSPIAADFHPNATGPDAKAVVVGGSKTNYERRSFISTFDGKDLTPVTPANRDSTGPYVDVEWRPQGDYALVLAQGSYKEGSVVACFKPCESGGDLAEFWRPAVTPYAEEGFRGREIAWHPSGNYTLLTGNGLMWMRADATFNHVDLGQDTFYSAVDWHPDGDFALLQKDFDGFAVCEEPCVNRTDLTNVANELCFGQYPDQDQCLDETDDDNETYPGYKSIEDIQFGPDGEKIYVTGNVDRRGRMMIITINNSSDPADWTWEYATPTSSSGDYAKFGELTGVDFHPDHDDRMIVSASLDRQATTYNTTTGNWTTLISTSEGKFQDAVWHPEGSYAFFPSLAGFFQYGPHGVPSVNITEPAAKVNATGPIELAGTAQPKEDALNITAIQATVDDHRPWQAVNDTNWTRHEDGNVTWNTTLDPTVAGAGHHWLRVRAADPILAGHPAATGACVGLSTDDVPDQDQLPTLSVEEDDPEAGTATIGWTNVTREHGYLPEDVSYDLKRHDPGAPFTNVTEWTVDDGAKLTVNHSTDDAEMDYTVRVHTCGQTLPWSAPLTVNVTEETDDEENATGNGTSDGSGSSSDGSDSSDDDGFDPVDPYEEGSDDDPSSSEGSDGTGTGDDPSSGTESAGTSDVPGPGAPMALLAAALVALRRRRR